MNDPIVCLSLVVAVIGGLICFGLYENYKVGRSLLELYKSMVNGKGDDSEHEHRE